MKIKIVRKADPSDITVINLSCIGAIRNNPIEGLAIYSEFNGTPAKFSDGLYDFYIIETHTDGRVYPEPSTVSILDIVKAYGEA